MSALGLLANAFGLGFAALLTQLALVRELSRLFTGNELFLCIALAGWVGGTALGSGWLFPRCRQWWQRSGQAGLAGCYLVYAWLFPLMLLLTRSARLWLNAGQGLELSLAAMLPATLLVTTPLAAVNGLAYAALLSFAESRPGPPAAGRRLGNWAAALFASDTLGACLAGICYTFWLAFHWQSWFLAAACLLAAAVYAGISLRQRQPWGWQRLAGLCLSIGLAGLCPALDRQSANWSQPPGARIFSQSTAQGHIALYRRQDTYDVYSSGQLAYAFPDPAASEPLALLPLLLAPKHGRLALFCSNPEVISLFLSRPGIEQIDVYAEDAQAQSELIRYLPASWRQVYSHAKVMTRFGDGRRLLKHEKQPYDLIVLVLPLPDHLAWNRFYTREFLNLLQSRLAPQGIILYSVPYSENRLQAGEAALLSAWWQTFRATLPHAVLYAGNVLYFAGSGRQPLENMSPAVLARRLEALGRPGRAFLPETIPLVLDAERSAAVLHTLTARAAPVNTDARPVLVGLQAGLWLARQAGAWSGLLLMALAALAVWLAWRSLTRKFHPELLLIGVAGGLGLALEWMVIAAYQACRGNVWQEIGLLFAAYMAGSCVGAGLGVKFHTPGFRRVGVFGLAGLSAGSAGLTLMTQGAPAVAGLCLFMCGAGAGHLYAVVCRGRDQQFAARAWAADCLGSVCGAMLAGLILLPALGLYAGLVPAGLLLGAFIFREPAPEKPAR